MSPVEQVAGAVLLTAFSSTISSTELGRYEESILPLLFRGTTPPLAPTADVATAPINAGISDNEVYPATTSLSPSPIVTNTPV